MKKIIIYVCIVFAIFACKENCRRFPDGLKGYIPYENEDTIIYTNLNNDTMSLLIIDKYISDSEYKTCRNCGCFTRAEFATNLNTKFNIRLYGKLGVSESSSELVYVFEDSSENTLGMIISSNDNKNPFLTENSNLYGDTVKQEITSTRFLNIKLVKSIGIIEFYDTLYKCNWELQR